MSNISIVRGGQQVKLLPLGICRIIDDDRAHCGINEDMEIFFGDYVTIDYTLTNGKFKIKDDYNNWVWSAAWIDFASTYQDLFVGKKEAV